MYTLSSDLQCAESADGKYSSSKMVTDQIAMLNAAYASARFRFTLSDVYKHLNKNWCVTARSETECDTKVLRYLHTLRVEV